MKTINTYINEKLRLTAKQQYTCQPKDQQELETIIIDRIKNDGPTCDLNDIDVSKIKYMIFLFDAKSNTIFKDFNGDISQWDVSNVKDMCGMFHGCEKFNCDISAWNVSNVEDMYGMFYRCGEFNQDISKWNVSNVDNIQSMFYKCKNFNQNLDSWDALNGKYKYMAYAFEDCPTTPSWYDRKKWEQC